MTTFQQYENGQWLEVTEIVDGTPIAIVRHEMTIEDVAKFGGMK